MVKHLLLIRHGEAELPSPDRKDRERPLTQKGLSDASRLGKKLDDNEMRPDVMLCSTAVRARETGMRLAEQVFFDVHNIRFEDELYEASVRTCLRMINETDNKHDKLCVIGHNPTLSYLAEYLAGDVVGNVDPASMVHLQFEVDSWAEISGDTGQVATVWHPA